MDTGCDHSNCAHSANTSVCQTLSEMDWERGLWNAAFNNEINRVQELIHKARNAVDVVNAPDNNGYTPLHYAARRGHVDVCRMLMRNGAKLDAQTRSGKATPLHKAAVAGHVSTVKLLIESGATIDLQDSDGQTALHKACDNKHWKLAIILLKMCPSLGSVKDNKGRVPDLEGTSDRQASI